MNGNVNNGYIFSFMGKIKNEEAYKTKLTNELKQAGTDEATLNSALKTNGSQVDMEGMTIENYKNLLEITKEGTPLNRMYDGIKVFQVEGMCGMDMGNMGEYVDSGMVLSGQELLDITDLLKGNANGQYSPEDLAAQLQEKGYNATAGVESAECDETSGAGKVTNSNMGLTITREDGSQIKLCDANGDGMLNSCDYDFSEALGKFEADMDAFNKNVAALEAKIEEHENVQDELVEEGNQIKEELDEVQETQTEINTEIVETDERIETYTEEMNNAIEKYELDDIPESVVSTSKSSEGQETTNSASVSVSGNASATASIGIGSASSVSTAAVSSNKSSTAASASAAASSKNTSAAAAAASSSSANAKKETSQIDAESETTKIDTSEDNFVNIVASSNPQFNNNDDNNPEKKKNKQ